jgi:hypothetical protein
MQQTAANAPSPTSASFAGLLAALAAPANAASDQTQPWSHDGLVDDYATLSYEQALRGHARFRSPNPPPDTDDFPLPNPVDPKLSRIGEAFPIAATSATPSATAPTVSASKPDWRLENSPNPPTALDRNLKSASITIRLSQAECAQLRTRAAEAGLTVSAYLRSCTFEAESLRALVKDTMAQLRSVSIQEDRAAAIQLAPNPASKRPFRRSYRQWWARFWPPTHARRSIAQA